MTVLLCVVAGHFLSRTLSHERPVSVVQLFVCSLSNDCQESGQDDFVDAYHGAEWVLSNYSIYFVCSPPLQQLVLNLRLSN